MTAFTLELRPLLNLNDDQFYELCQINPALRFERTPLGELLVMPPTGGETGHRNSEINADFVIWNRRTQLGKVFDSSTCFKLPGGGDRSPDVAWVQSDRWDALTPKQRERFPPIAPDFALELMSPSDPLSATQAKMLEYRDCGVRLGWLIHRKARFVEIYRLGQAIEILKSPTVLSGEAVMPGFELRLSAVW